MKKVCRFCNNEFECEYMRDIFCDEDCKEKFRVKDRLDRWTNGERKPNKPKAHQDLIMGRKCFNRWGRW